MAGDTGDIGATTMDIMKDQDTMVIRAVIATMASALPSAW